MTAVCKTCLAYPAFDKLFENGCLLERVDKCDYCGKKSEEIALVVSELAAYIMEQVQKEYTDPANELPYDGREGGYQGNVIDNPGDLFAEIEFELENSQLMEYLCDCLGADVWLCRDNYFALEPHKRLRFGWQRFCKVVKHERRYTFWSAFDDTESEYDPDYLPTAKVLAEVADNISTTALAKPFATSTKIWRARVHSPDNTLSVATDFAAPPVEFAKYSNRMSPAGVSMFYGADSVATAIAEVVENRPLEKGKVVSVAAFSPTRELQVLDLADLPDVPSFFDDRDTLRHSLYFLVRFRHDVSQPVKKDGREHVEYVPTQAFAEFIRHEVKGPSGDAIDGIRYTSAIGPDTCYAIFADHEACLPEVAETWRDHTPLLTFDAESVRTLSPGEVARLPARPKR